MSKNPFMSMGTLGLGLGFALNGAAFQPTINYDTLRQQDPDQGVFANPQFYDAVARQQLQQEEQKIEDPVPGYDDNEQQPLLQEDELFQQRTNEQQPVEFSDEPIQQISVEPQPSAEQDEQQPLLQIDNQQLVNIVPELRRDDFQNWMSRFDRFIASGEYARLREALKNARDTSLIIAQLYHIYSERKDLGNLQKIEPPEQDPQQEINFIREITQRPLPSHCRRDIYRDAQGRLRTRIICESLGETRQYYDK